MKIYDKNYLNTTTQFTCGDDLNTASVQFVIDNNKNSFFRASWSGTSLNSVTSTFLYFSFPETTTADTLIILNHNLSTNLSLCELHKFTNDTTTADTTVSAIPFSGTTDIVLEFTSTVFENFSVGSNVVAGYLKFTKMSASSSFNIGEIAMTQSLLNFTRTPSAPDYNAQIYTKQVRQEMPNGGISVYNVARKYRATIKLQYITETFKDQLYNLYNTSTNYWFMPFPNTTTFDGEIYNVVWSGNFNFKPSANNLDAGYTGQFVLEEAP